jgi:threonine 3-dehydrogenase
MKAVVKKEPGPGVEYMEVPVPKPGSRDVLVRVIATSICGTDLHIYKWDPWSESRIKPPRIIGHEFVGEIVEVGREVKAVRAGDYVTAETHIACGHCITCRTGQAHICLNLEILGIDRDGSFAEYIVIPEENAWVTDRSIPPEIATIQEPLGNAVHATLIEDITGKSVAVFGCGPIGLFSIAVARASGAEKIFAVEVNPLRLSLAEKMGAHYTINPLDKDPVAFIMDETSGYGVDVFLEMSGAEEAIKRGMKVVRKGGRVSFLGIPPGPVSFDFSEDIVFKGIRMYGINGRLMYDTWFKVKSLLERDDFDLSPVITHKYPLSEIHRAMALIENKEAAKVVLYPE